MFGEYNKIIEKIKCNNWGAMVSDFIEIPCKVNTKGWFWVPISRNNREVFSNALLKFANRELELGCIDINGNYSLLNKIQTMDIK